MATKSIIETINAAEAAEAVSTPKVVGKFTFAVVENVEVPAEALTATRSRTADENSFSSIMADIFARMAFKHHAHAILPTEFWTAPEAEGGRAMAAEKVTDAFVKQKVRDAFTEFKLKSFGERTDSGKKTADGKTIWTYPVEYHRYSLTLWPKDGGMGIWMDDKEKSAPAK